MLIILPLVAGGSFLFITSDALRRLLVAATAGVVCLGSILLAAAPGVVPSIRVPFDAHAINLAMLAVEIAMAIYIIYVGARAWNALIVLLAAAQLAVLLWFEFKFGESAKVSRNLLVDQFSVLMALINGIVGGGICLYALAYMREYHQSSHPEISDRRPLFFALLFVFMGAMFGLVFSNNLLWLGFFWEITTLCSFLLIGYSRTPEADNNALRALVMNLAGGLAFTLAAVEFFKRSGELDLSSLITSKSSIALLPAALFCFAGVTKSAQLPFSSWLLGAMVAPTPVSALLHSSTMVKAGVYLVLRMAPIVAHTRVGLLLAIVGGLTFVVGSFSAITSNDAKRVLAHSTIANLGLIVLCGGIGTPQAVWAGILLIVFHAVAKCLLFLCVGIVEHEVHSRDIEAMSGLIRRMPQVALMMLIGMAGMFLAPFGMLISKWAVLKAVVDASPMLSIFIVFGSSATLFFWAKWMGKLLQIDHADVRIARELSAGEFVSMYGLAAATFSACLFFPLISSRLAEPYVRSVFGQAGFFAQGNLIIMGLMMAIVLLFPFTFLQRARNVKVVESYLGGANVHDNTHFLGAGNATRDVAMGNYYLRDLLNEQWLSRRGGLISTLLLAIMLGVAL
jgi:ech hydrogenase subunit A